MECTQYLWYRVHLESLNIKDLCIYIVHVKTFQSVFKPGISFLEVVIELRCVYTSFYILVFQDNLRCL